MHEYPSKTSLLPVEFPVQPFINVFNASST